MESRIASWQLLDNLFTSYRADLRATSAEEALHTLAVTLEDALSRWFVAGMRQNGLTALKAVGKDVERVAVTAAQKELARQGLDDAKYKVAIQVNFLNAQKVYAADVERFLDKGGLNLTFESHREWVEKGGRLLDQPFKAAATSLTEDDWVLIGLVKHLRNYIAHRSSRSRIALNDVIVAIKDGPHADLCWSRTRRIAEEDGKRAGDFLVRETSDDQKKVLELIEDRLSAILSKLAAG